MTITVTGTVALASQSFNVVNVKDYGAVGNGIADDTVAIQNSIDAAFGPAGSPHGNTNRFQNVPLYFPAGNYNITSPLYLTYVVGGWIFGNGMNSTRISYSGAFSGNTVATTVGGANAITPIFMTRGFAFSKMSGLDLAIGSTNSAGVYLYQDGTPVGASTHQNSFSDILAESANAGFLIGYQSNGLCSENLFYNCATDQCTYGFRNISSNALNNNMVSCGPSNGGTGFSCPTGSIQIHCASLAGNTTVDIATGQQPMTIVGTRTESKNFIDMSGSQTLAYVSGCNQADTGQAGYFINLGNSGAILDSCVQESTSSTAGLIQGGPANIYIRNCDLRNLSSFANFTGLVGEYSSLAARTVANLPSPSVALKGLRQSVTDSTQTTSVSTFGAIVAGTGTASVPIFCDGTNWRIG